MAVITARAGSKRLPNKNELDLAGKPLIAWTVEAAIKSKYIDRCVVSTDSIKLKEISEKFGAEVPFIRPLELAKDTTSSIDVIFHTIDNLKETFDYLILLQPTSPLRTTENIDAAIEAMESSKALVSVCETEHSPLWTNTLENDLSMANFIKPELIGKRSQDLPKYYRINGAIYIAELKYLQQNNGFLGHETKAFIMSQENSIDIDTAIDFKLSEIIINNNGFK
ncbi:MAG: acylneuraminate cytidylyltransferase family protein [Bacteroidales bacterium]|nr:acylneuraminate cytidylyltransferase family protein [Bacteroidales bacterium]